MKLGSTWRSLFLLLPVLLVLGGLAAAFDAVLAAPAPSVRDDISDMASIKDGDDEDDGDDDSGHGRGGDDNGNHDDDDGAGDVARPVIDPDEMGDVVIEIIDEQFVPAEVTIDAGQSVTFINLDDDEHTATGIGFDTGVLNPGDWATITLEKSGEAPFTCQFHPEMLGKVMVQGDDMSASPVAASPVASPVALGTPGSGDAESANDVTVSIIDFAFETPELEIPAGTTITWVNDGQAIHTVTGPFGDSGVIQPGDSFSFTFDEAGSFDYVCQLHPQMTGRIVVT